MRGLKLILLVAVFLLIASCKQETIECAPLDESEFEFLQLDNITSSPAPSTVIEVIDNNTVEKVSDKWPAKIQLEPIVKKFVEGDLVSFQNIKIKNLDNATNYTFTEPLNKFGQWQTRIGDAGEYTVFITANNELDLVIQEVLLVIKPKNTLPKVKLDSFKAVEGEIITLNPRISDQDGDVVTVEYFPPFNSQGVWQTRIGDAGEYTAKVIVRDGFEEVIFETLVTVISLNHPPIITLENNPVYVKENQTIILNPVVTDLDKDEIIITYFGWMNESSKQTSFYDAGTYQVVIKASDGKDEVQENVVIIVEDVNRMPVFNV
ncbi:hypothetical protein HYV79_02365 [Candidatus Woesearchaeota archaeon]|nr:hypothetical protein [Candidatus Woesearchaeota archaeon]